MQDRIGQRHARGAWACALLLAASLAWPAAAFAQNSQTTAEAPSEDPQMLYEQGLQAEWSGMYQEARILHARAADLGSAQAHYQLGFLLLDGLGGPRDVEAARHHLRTAADNGVTLALVPYMYSFDAQDDPDLPPDARIAAHALLELSLRDLATAGDTIQFWSQPMRRQVQAFLQEAGYYRGAIDGLIGQGSLNALRAFARQRAALPALPDQSFARITLTDEGVLADDRPPYTWQDIDSLVDARAAFAGATVEQTEEAHWRIGVDGEALLDWPQDEGGADTTDEPELVFQLPGKPQRTDLQFGMPFAVVSRDDLGECALRAEGEGDFPRHLRRCETRTTGVVLVFQAINGPYDDLETVFAGPLEPFGERLVAIDLAPPPALRLAGAQED